MTTVNSKQWAFQYKEYHLINDNVLQSDLEKQK